MSASVNIFTMKEPQLIVTGEILGGRDIDYIFRITQTLSAISQVS